jgi:glycine/D-amino acid oxidase-like deaminating enzyme
VVIAVSSEGRYSRRWTRRLMGSDRGSGNGGKEHLSYWIAANSGDAARYPAQDGDLRADVAVLGGGIVGLTAAALLKRAGKSVALVEMSRVGTGVTGHSTAKITSQHELVYAELKRRSGDTGARSYAEANQAALERIAAFVEEDGIDCSFERQPNYVFTESEDYLPALREEARAAAGVGLPASFVEETPLPFPVLGAVRFEDQAQFDSCAYLLGLAAEVDGEGSRVYENTRALDVQDADSGGSCTVQTDRGTITANDVVMATHIPFPFKGEY